MKILMVNKFLYKVGGCENYMFGLAEALEKNGHEIQYFGLKSPKNTVGNKFNIYVNSYDDLKIFNPFSLVYNKKAKKLMLKILDLYKPDLVHMNNIYYHLSSSIIDACKVKGVPVVMTIHDYQLVCPNHMLYRFDIDSVCEECVKNKNAKSCKRYKCVKNSKLKSILASMESNRIHKKKPYDYVSKFICPSQFIMDKLIEGGYDQNKMLLMRNFVNSSKCDSVPCKKDYALYFGRLSNEKGIELLIEAWPDNAKLVIAGTGPLQDKIKNINKPNVEYVGFTTGEPLTKLIKEAKFSIYPSKWFENCPLSIIESISLCTPVVAANAGGNPELIDDKTNGLLYKNNDAVDLKNKIEYLLTNPTVLQKMYKNCLDYKRVPNINEYYNNIIKEYESLAKNTNLLNRKLIQ